MSKKGHGGGGVGHSAPLWFISWADMCTLMLGFFIMMYALSDSGKNEKYTQMVASVQEAFGIQPGMGLLSQVPQELSPMARMQARAGQTFPIQPSNDSDPGIDGQHTTVRRIREGLEFCVGGTVAFEDGKAELLPPAKADLLKVAEVIRGYNNKVDIRGHTSRAALPPGSPFKDHIELSFFRAKAVRDFLVANGIRENRMRVTGVGYNEPLVLHAYSAPARVRNSRVEIIVNESLVQEYEGEPSENPGPPSSGEPQGVSNGG